MAETFSNGSSRLPGLSNYLSQTKQLISRVNQSAGQSITNNDASLYRIHSDRAPAKLLKLMQEMQRATGEGNDPNLHENKVKNTSLRGLSGAGKGQSIFSFSEKQIWSNFAKEITKSLKRNM